ncbi:MAG: damage-inducible protein DinB [Acetobacteraceae bacterium]|nr:damage-inducible protein DinB [Acetobacteraceae bacterium]
MISVDWCRLMAAYNSEMNRRLYRAAEAVPDIERRADRGAFFGSIHGTLNHLLWADRLWMSRFAGKPRPPGSIKDSPRLIEDWDLLRSARAEADAGIEAWAAGLTPAWLSRPLTWLSSASGRETTRPAWVTVAHFFNHQTHHRGQVHCLITQRGVKTEDTDLPWAVDLPALGIG